MKVGFNVPFAEFNKNGRIYTKKAIEKAIDEYKECVKEKRSFGELGPRSEMCIDLNNVSHIITDIETTDDGVKGELEVITSKGYDTQGVISTCGDRVAAIMEGNELTVKPFMINDTLISFDVMQ